MINLSLSDQELLDLLNDLESDRAERKESFSAIARDKVRQAVCAFANDLPGHDAPGVVFVGADDDGEASGLAITDVLLQQLAAIKNDGNILPPLSMAVEKCHLKGADMAVIVVAPSDAPPVRFKGRISVRTGPRHHYATAQDERILNEKRRYGDRPFDAQGMPSACLSDLNRARFESEYLPSAIAPEVLEANNRSLEERLAASKMILSVEEPTPTVLGLLVLSSRTRDFLPGAYIQFLRIRGTELSDPIVDEQDVDGPLTDLLRRIDEKLEAHNTTSIDLTSGLRENRSSAYPLGALRQIVFNAVMHRTYESTNAPVRITWFDDRIEIQSPGGPFGLVRADNFGQPGVTDYRNPNLAEAMKTLGFVQRYGVGIATAEKLLKENGNSPLEFEIDASIIGITLRART